MTPAREAIAKLYSDGARNSIVLTERLIDMIAELPPEEARAILRDLMGQRVRQEVRRLASQESLSSRAEEKRARAGDMVVIHRQAVPREDRKKP